MASEAHHRETPRALRRSVRPRRGFLLVGGALLAACGGDPIAHPTGPVAAHETRAGAVAAHEWTCAAEVLAVDGRLAVRVSPSTLYLELREGPCGEPGTVLATSPTGDLTVQLTQPAAVYQVRIGNPTDGTVSYSLDVEYLGLSI